MTSGGTSVLGLPRSSLPDTLSNLRERKACWRPAGELAPQSADQAAACEAALGAGRAQKRASVHIVVTRVLCDKNDCLATVCQVESSALLRDDSLSPHK